MPMCQIIAPCPDMRIGHNLSTLVTIGVSHEHVGSRRSKTETSQSILASSALQAGSPRSTCASGLYCNVIFTSSSGKWLWQASAAVLPAASEPSMVGGVL